MNTQGQKNIGDQMKAWSRQDWMIIGGGLAAFIFSFFDYVGISIRGFGSYSISAWHSYAILGLLLVFAAAVVWALHLLEVVKLPDLPLPLPRAAAIVAGIGTLLLLLRGVTYGTGVGLRFGGIVLIVAGVVMTVGCVLADRAAPKTAGKS